MKLNKKAEVSIVVIIILALVGILIGVKTGFFGIFQPPSPGGISQNIAHTYYYDIATDNPIYSCQQQTSVIFRSAFLHSITEIPGTGTGNYIAVDEGGVELQKMAPGNSLLGQSASSCSSYGLVKHTLSGGLKVVKTSPTDYKICKERTDGKTDYRTYTTNAPGTINIQRTATGVNEIISLSDIKDAGKFACLNNNVQKVYCGNFAPELKETCTLGCEYLTSDQPVAGQITPSVKCKGIYEPNLQLCGIDGKTKYTVSSDGNLITSESCGNVCNQKTINLPYSATAECVDCASGWKQCNTLTDSVQTCNNGVYADTQSCTGDSFCQVSGEHVAACQQSNLQTDKRCSPDIPKQPQKRNTDNTAWINDGDPCDIACSGAGICTPECTWGINEIQCEPAAGNKLFICKDTDRDYERVIYPTGTNGICLNGCSIDYKKCEPINEIKDFCREGNVWRAVSDTSTGAILRGGVTENLQETCANGCNQDTSTTASCRTLDICNGEGGNWVCKSGEPKRILCSLDEQSVTQTEDCTTTKNNNNAFCQVNSIGDDTCELPSSQCSGTFACKNGEMYSCSNGYFGTPLDTCNRLGCSIEGTGLPSNTNSQCNNDEDYVNRLNECVAGNSVNFLIKNVTDKDGVQYTRGTTTTCGTEGCDSTTGQCESQCTPGQDVCSGGKVYSCPSGSFGPEKYSCLGNLGCNTQGTACKNECEVSGDYQCIDETGGQESSGLCLPPDTTTGQRLLQKTTCGSGGCNAVTNRCIVAGNPGDYICKDIVNNFGGSIYQISTDGLSEIFRTSCNDLTQNGLNAFCKVGDSQCNYCLLGFDYCSSDGTQKFVCSNAYTGEQPNPVTCNAGCVSIGNSKYCDQLSVLLGRNNFRPEDNVLLSATLSGLPSNRFISGKKVKFTLTGPGLTAQSYEVLTSADGSSSKGYGLLSLGTYNAKIEFPEYPVSYTKEFIVTITDDFIIQPQSQIIQLVPGVEHSIKVVAKKDTKAPTSLSIAETPPEGLTLARLESTGILGEWKLILEGEPGSYTLKIKADSNPSQDVPVQLVKPILKIDSNIPTSSTLGSKNFDVSISGPKDSQGQIKGLVPNTITGSVTYNGQITPITLATTTGGEGKYTTSYNFASEGTYTINVEATKEGYESIEKSFAIQVSSSGTAQPPGTDTGTGDGTGTGTGAGQPGIPTQPKIPTWAWIVGVGIAAYYFFGRKKK